MRRQLSKREVREINEQIAKFEFQIAKRDKAELVEGHIKVLLISNEPLFFYYENKILPTLRAISKKNPLKTITVDMGAIKFVVNGADIMRPGITKCDPEIKKDEPVAIIDETHVRPIAVGIALLSGRKILEMKSGKAVKNIHWVGDHIWDYSRVVKDK